MEDDSDEWIFHSDSEIEDAQPSKRRRVVKTPAYQSDCDGSAHRSIRGFSLDDETKLTYCPAILYDLMTKILVIDSLCDVFKPYGRNFRRCGFNSFKCCGRGNFVEMFSGGPKGRAVTNGFRTRGWRGNDFDKEVSQDFDFTTPLGFCITLLAIFRLAMGDALWTGLVCTSFCWVNRSTSERSPSNRFLGNTNLKHVAIGNLILYRNLLLLLLHQTCGGIIMLEQPLGSCMPQVPIFRSTWKFLEWNYVVVWLGAYGAESKKPIKIFSPVTWIANLKKPLDRNHVFQSLCTTDINGKHTGKSKELKSSQHYPQGFGDKVAVEFIRNLGCPPARTPPKRKVDLFIARHDWSQAKLDDVEKWLDKVIAKLKSHQT
jgi:hypothetical protein